MYMYITVLLTSKLRTPSYEGQFLKHSYGVCFKVGRGVNAACTVVNMAGTGIYISYVYCTCGLGLHVVPLQQACAKIHVHAEVATEHKISSARHFLVAAPSPK